MKNIVLILLLLPCRLFAQRNITSYTPDEVIKLKMPQIHLEGLVVDSATNAANAALEKRYLTNDTLNKKMFSRIFLETPSLLFINSKEVDESSVFFLSEFSREDTSKKNFLVKENRLTPAFAMKRYGEKGANGARELTLKNVQVVPFYSLLRSFHLPQGDENLPVFLVAYNRKKVIFPDKFYVSPDIAKWCKINVVKGLQGKEINLQENYYSAGLVALNMLNGKLIDEATLFCINPSWTINVVSIYKDSALKKMVQPFVKQYMYGYNVTIKNERLLLNLDELFRLFSVKKKYRQWPLILEGYGTIRYPNLFFATKGQIESVTVNKTMKYIAIKSKYPFPPLSSQRFGDVDTLPVNGIKTIPQRIIEIEKKLPVIIYAIS